MNTTILISQRSDISVKKAVSFSKSNQLFFYQGIDMIKLFTFLRIKKNRLDWGKARLCVVVLITSPNFSFILALYPLPHDIRDRTYLPTLGFEYKSTCLNFINKTKHK
jgi:hypothetical protein